MFKYMYNYIHKYIHEYIHIYTLPPRQPCYVYKHPHAHMQAHIHTPTLPATHTSILILFSTLPPTHKHSHPPSYPRTRTRGHKKQMIKSTSPACLVEFLKNQLDRHFILQFGSGLMFWESLSSYRGAAILNTRYSIPDMGWLRLVGSLKL